MEKQVKRIAEELTKIRKLMEQEKSEKVTNKHCSIKVDTTEAKIDPEDIAKELTACFGKYN